MAAGTATLPPIRKVAFTCDLLRFSLGPRGYVNGQVGNLRWLQSILGGMTEWPEMGIDVQTCEPAPDLATQLRALRSTAVRREYERDSESAWARHYAKPPQQVLPAWLDSLAAADLVIGFELPPGLKRALHGRGQRYISFHIHALRFLRDLCLGASTNHPALARRLDSCGVGAEEVQSQVRRFKAQLHKHALASFELPAQWPLLIGQTGRDSILIDKGRFADWHHFEQRLARLLDPHPGCVLLEHPMRGDSIGIAQYLRMRFGKPVVMSNANGYGSIFHAHRIPQAITLASSLGVEAQAVGIDTRFLLGDPRQRLQLEGVDVGTAQPLDHRVLTPGFWQELFAAPGGALPKGRTMMTASFAWGDNYLRRGLEAWSYGHLERGLLRTRARKVLLPSEDMGAAREHALTEVLAGQRGPAHGWSSPPGRAKSDLGVDMFIAGRLVGLGETRSIEGSDPWAPLLLEGFHERETWGVWSARSDARIRLGLAPSAVAAKARLHMTLSLRIFEGLLPRCPVCRIQQDGTTLALLFFRPSSSINAELEIEAVARQPWCNLDLQLSDADSPNRVLGHPDQRVLGIALRGIKVRVLPGDLEAGPTADAPAPTIWGLRTDAAAFPPTQVPA